MFIEELKKRRNQFKWEMEKQKCDIAIITLPENIYYLTGYNTSRYFRFMALVFPKSGSPTLILPKEEASISKFTPAVHYNYTDKYDEILIKTIKEYGDYNTTVIGLEQQYNFLPISIYKTIETYFNVYDISGTVEKYRIIKSNYELNLIRKAGNAAKLGMEKAREIVDYHNITENDIAAEIYKGIIHGGSDYPGSPPYVSSGERTGIPFATWEGRGLKKNDVVLIEFAASYNRYNVATMRTLFRGDVDRKKLFANDILVDTLNVMKECIKPGVSARYIDQVCKGNLMKYGFDREHISGYSIGIAFPPGWNEGYAYPLGPNNFQSLQEGMVLYLLPSISIDKKYTIGHGDTVIVNKNGYEVVTA